MIRVEIPAALRTLAGVSGPVELEVEGTDGVTLGVLLDALERKHPVLRGAVRDHGGGKRRAFIRFFVCGEDWSHEAYDRLLPERIVSGEEPFLIIGAMAGG